MESRRLLFALAATSLFAVAVSTSIAADTAPAVTLKLFGATLKDASRAPLRKAFAAANLKAIREDERYWVDKYDASNALDGASELGVGYVSATSQFAFAQYLPSLMYRAGCIADVRVRV